MKNKMGILAAVLTLLLCLTACDKSNIDSGSSSDTPISSTDNSSGSPILSEDSSSTLSQDVTSNEGEKSKPLLENNFPESFTGYLGETLHGADASEQLGNSVFFDGFTYLRWATPVFDNTMKTPDLINRDTYEMPKYDDILSQNQKNPKWFSVKTGDSLENGLVVKSASCGFEKATFYDGSKAIMQMESMISFENTLTLTGVLYCSPEDDVYVIPGDLFFFADPTVNPNIPIICKRGKPDEYSLDKFVADSGAVVFDGMILHVGNTDTVAVDMSGIITRGEFCEVRVTLDNIRLTESDRLPSGAFADIVSVEKIND